MGADLAHVLLEGGDLVTDDVEGLPGRVEAGRGVDPLVQLGLAVAGDGAAGVRDDEDARDVEQVCAEDERLEGLRRDASARVAEDLGVAGLQADHGERVDARVHAGDDGDARVRDAVEARQVEGLGVGAVRLEEVVEGAHVSESSLSLTRQRAGRLDC